MKEEIIDKHLSLFISLQVFLLGAKNSLIEGLPFLFLINDTLNLLIMAFVGVLYLYAMIISRSRHLPLSGMLFWLFILFSYIFTFFLFPKNIYYIEGTALRVLNILFLTSILISKLHSFEFLDKYMTFFSYPTIIAGVIAGFFISLIGQVTTSEQAGNQYAMSLSYAVLMGVMWLLHRFFKSGGGLPLFFTIIGIIVILLYGSRNPLLSIVAYVLFELWDKANHDTKNGAIYKTLLVCAGFMALFYKTIINFLADVSTTLGFNSRTLGLLSVDEVSLSNRDVIHQEIWNLINDNPLIGVGIEGDRANIGEMAHSLYLSILCTYGYVIGFFFMLIIAIWLIKALKRSIGLDHQILVLYLCLVLPRGFTGGDMWQSDIFWWLIAIIFVIQSKKYNCKNNSIEYHNKVDPPPIIAIQSYDK